MNLDKKVIEYLNKVLYNELTAINQYYLHGKMLKNWGLNELAECIMKASMVEMKHADALAERILFLEELPNFQTLGKLRIGENPREVLECDLQLEMDDIAPLLREAIAYAESANDFVSRKLFVDILRAEEDYIDWLETQLDLMDRIGEENYLQTKMEN